MNNPIIHTNRLYPDRLGNVALGIAVEERFIEVLALHLRLTGEHLFPPEELNKDMILWRTMRVRHRKKDFRVTEDEVAATQRIAQWTLDIKNLLTDQEPVKLEFIPGV